jgi:hypothetical protein
VYFGLGQDKVVELIQIQWPSGALQELKHVQADRYLNVDEPMASSK